MQIPINKEAPRGLKPRFGLFSDRSAEALRHPKAMGAVELLRNTGSSIASLLGMTEWSDRRACFGWRLRSSRFLFGTSCLVGMTKLKADFED